MAEAAEILWNLYQEHSVWERHHENQRASATNLLVAVSAGVLGLVTFDGELDRADLPLTGLLTLLGVFGALFSAKQYSLFRKHQERASRYRRALDERFPEARILQTRQAADDETRREWPRIAGSRLHTYWICLDLILAAFGVVLTLAIWR